jgi:hypothetical protein
MSTFDHLPLPTRDNGLIYLCRLAREDASFLPLVFEALLHMPVALLVDPGKSPPLLGTGMEREYPLLQIRHPATGIIEFSAALFSDMEHFHAFHPERAPYSFGFPSGLEPFEQIAACSLRLPVVVDPCSPHAVVLPHEKLKHWLAIWRASPRPADPMARNGCVFRESTEFSQPLLDRLAAFLSRFDAVERAYLVSTHPVDYPEYACLTLAVSCSDDSLLERIGRALGLLRYGLLAEETPKLLVPLARYPALDRDFASALQPVYVRAMSRWLYEGMTA